MNQKIISENPEYVKLSEAEKLELLKSLLSRLDNVVHVSIFTTDDLENMEYAESMDRRNYDRPF